MPRGNNFDILRLVFAWMVVFYHSARLSRAASLDWMGHWVDGTVAVQGFFVISGCVIAMSYHRDSNLKRYFVRRAKRILPAYFASTVFVLVLGCLMSTMRPLQFLVSKGTLQYLGSNIILIGHGHPYLPGLFVGNPEGPAVNGALWTIKVEVMFYLFVPIFFWLSRRLGQLPTMLGICAVSLLYHYVLTYHHVSDEYVRQLPGQLTFFIAGAAAYLYYPKLLKLRSWIWVAAAGNILCWAIFHAYIFRVGSISLATVAVALLLPVFKGPTRYGDFSYGTYVMHFPVIQAVVAAGLFARSPSLGVGISVLVVLILSVSSWNLVEKRFLVRGSAVPRKPQLAPAVS